MSNSIVNEQECRDQLGRIGTLALRLFLALLFYAFVGACWVGLQREAKGEIIPLTNRITWEGYVGIPSNAITLTTTWTMYTNMYGINSNGTADVTVPINHALSLCPANQYVYVPPGTYSNAAPIIVTNDYTSLRGAGPTLTIFNSNSSGDANMQIGENNTSSLTWYPDDAAGTRISGATKGSTTIGVVSATGMSVGKGLEIDQHNISGLASPLGGEGNGDWNSRSNGVRCMRQIVEITGVSGTNITITPPLVYDFTNVPMAIPFTFVTKYAGIEDLKISGYNGSGNKSIQIYGGYRAFVRRVDLDYSDGDQIHIASSLQCEVRDSYVHDGFIHGAGTTDDTIKITEGSSFNLVENCILRRLHCGVMYWGGGVGNTISYCFITNTYDVGSTLALYPDIDFHGGHPIMNLTEGTIAGLYNADGTWGTASHGTALRCFFTGQNYSNDPDGDDGREGGGYIATESSSWTKQYAGAWAVNISGFGLSQYFNIVGCRLGLPTMGKYPDFNPVRKVAWNTFNEYDHEGFVIRLGYQGIDSGSGSGSTIPNSSLLDHGNYDAVTTSITYDAGIADHTIPTSYLYSTRPAWIPSVSWPFNANGLAAITNVPAAYRWAKYVETGEVTNLFNIVNESSSSSAVVGASLGSGASTRSGASIQ